jgi:radical SAM protein with 4Fe4S-binding SPASM domain
VTGADEVVSSVVSLVNRLTRQKSICAQVPNLLLSCVSLFRKPMEVRSRPAYIQVEPTIRCNLRCKMCDSSRVNSAGLDLSLGRFRSILDQFAHVAQVHLQGLGEPLLNSAFFRMVAEAKERGIYVSTFTNVTLISERIADRIVTCGLDQLWFSLDGATAETYEDIRIGSSFRKVTENIRRVVDLSKDPRTRLGIWFVAMKRNIHELPLLPKLAKELGIENLRVELVDTWGKIVPKQLRDLAFTSKHDTAELIDNCGKALRIARSSRLKLELNPRLGSVVNIGRLSGCWQPWLSTYITAEGFVTPCCRRPDPRVFAFGNLFKEKFSDIWNNAKYQTFRHGLTLGKAPEICRDCLFACHVSSVPFLKHLGSNISV